MKNIIYIFIFLCLAHSCIEKSVSPSEMINWVEADKNGLKKIQRTKEIIFEVLYKPVDYIIAIENRSNQISNIKYSNLISELAGLQYLELRLMYNNNTENILSGNIDSEEEYFERLDYFVTHARNDMYLVDGSDTLLPILYHFERNYGLTSQNKILLAYSNKSTKKDKHFFVNDQIFGSGKIKFEFNIEDIKSMPVLKVN